MKELIIESWSVAEDTWKGANLIIDNEEIMPDVHLVGMTSLRLT